MGIIYQTQHVAYALHLVLLVKTQDCAALANQDITDFGLLIFWEHQDVGHASLPAKLVDGRHLFAHLAKQDIYLKKADALVKL